MKIRPENRSEVYFWMGMMASFLALMVLALIFQLRDPYPLFAKHHISEEFDILSMVLALVSGYLFYRKNRQKWFYLPRMRRASPGKNRISPKKKRSVRYFRTPRF